jgi:hypothetical protein
MRVPLGAFGLAGSVERRSGVVEQQERVRLGHRQTAGERPADGNPGALEGVIGRDDLADRPGLDVVGSGRAIRGGLSSMLARFRR